MNKPDLRSYTLEELKTFVLEQRWPGYRAEQLFSWLQQKGAMSFDEMSNLPQDLRSKLAQKADLAAPTVVRKQISASSDTAKLLLELADGEKIEMALMLYKRMGSRDRATCCVSSQSGCAMGCAFCATGQFRQFRNLSAGEIVVQALLADKTAQELGFAGLTNVVYMGMGEPLSNLEEVRKSISLLNDDKGLNIGIRRITVSTCGLVPQIYKMSGWDQPVELAVSLHSADETLRKKIMPGAACWTIKDLMSACRVYREKTGRRITFEYALFDGINDSIVSARQLGDLLTGEDILVNIIPANPAGKEDFRPSPPDKIVKFIDTVKKYGVNLQIREARGLDIDAACGQLRRRS